MPLVADAINQILPFAPEALEEAGDLLPLAEYKTETMRKRGFRSGLARRSLFNRAHRQSAHMASGLAQFIANRYAPGVVDDADLDKVEEGLRHSIQAMIDAGAINVSVFAPKSRKINTTAPLTGGGDLSADRTLAINAVSAPTANAVILRDSAGRAQVAAPSAVGDIARKDTVDAVNTALNTHAALTTAHGSTSAATANTIIQRDAAGRAQVAAPSAAADIARKADVDANASIGVNQTWTAVTRTIGVTYTNTTGRPLSLAVEVSAPNIAWTVYLRVNGANIQAAGLNNTTASFSVLVPPGQTYGIFHGSGTQGSATSYEMR